MYCSLHFCSPVSIITFEVKSNYTKFLFLEMEKESRRLMVLATSSTACFLILFLLCTQDLYRTVNPFTSWEAQRKYKKETTLGSLLRLATGDSAALLKSTGIACQSDLHSAVCLTSKQVWIQASPSLKVYVPDNYTSAPEKPHFIKPYARQEDETAMNNVSPVEIYYTQERIIIPACDIVHSVPAVVFSSGGFVGNLFHEFNEIIIPLFLTTRHFRSSLQFIITDFAPWWVTKYNQILIHLSHYEVINPALDGRVHCFPAAVVGLKYHDNLAINKSDVPGGYSMSDFRQFLREAYNLKQANVQRRGLILMSRSNSRIFLNEDEMAKMMKELGFNVVIARGISMSNLHKFSKVVNSCSLMVGAHGAGLSNAVFLPAGAVVVQVVPIGLDWASDTYYGKPVGEMGLKYLKYKIKPEESSLSDLYGPESSIVADPASVFAKGYSAARAAYVDGQNMKINLTRFRETLVHAIKLVATH